MTAHSEAMELYLERVGIKRLHEPISVSEPQDGSTAMVRCVDCRNCRAGCCTRPKSAGLAATCSNGAELGPLKAKWQWCRAYLARPDAKAQA